MSATVEVDYVYYATCPDCATASATVESEEDAEEWAANHNTENHDENDRTDADYDHYKESLRDQQ